MMSFDVIPTGSFLCHGGSAVQVHDELKCRFDRRFQGLVGRQALCLNPRKHSITKHGPSFMAVLATTRPRDMTCDNPTELGAPTCAQYRKKGDGRGRQARALTCSQLRPLCLNRHLCPACGAPEDSLGTPSAVTRQGLHRQFQRALQVVEN